MAVSDAQKRASAKHDKENFQYITFKAKKGSKERLVEAATIAGMSTNGFIRASLNKSVGELLGKPMEPLKDNE
jgi:predicted HicB family RNase H-like nuclease